MAQQSREIAVGSLIAVRNSTDSNCWLGLVVDQEVGKKWADRDPCIEYDPSDKQEFFLARVLGVKVVSTGIGRTGLPEQEPYQTVTVRWAYVQLNQAHVVAGPDVASIELFLEQYMMYIALGMKGNATFGHDLSLVLEYLHGVKREKDATSFFERKFFAMLGEVLPRT